MQILRERRHGETIDERGVILDMVPGPNQARA